MFPITIIDDFLPKPDKFVDFIKTLEFKPTPTGNYPGERSKPINLIDEFLFRNISRKVITTFYAEPFPQAWGMDMTVQRVKPFVKSKEDQFLPYNKGWIHTDTGEMAVGVLYLDKDPIDSTGTIFYEADDICPSAGFNWMDIKENHYKGEKKYTREEYNEAFIANNSQYKKTITVENVYNRLIVFRGNQYHSADTFGYGKKYRHILNMFIPNFYGASTPFQRNGMI